MIKIFFLVIFFTSTSIFGIANASLDNKTTIKKVEYYFWYGCSHCNSNNDEITKIMSDYSKDYQTELIPAVSSDIKWINAAKSYYLGKSSKNPDNFHKLMFKLIHYRGLNIMDKPTMARVMELYEGMPENKFNELYEGTPMRDLIKYATSKTESSDIDSVPTIRIIYTDNTSINFGYSSKPSGVSFSDWINE